MELNTQYWGEGIQSSDSRYLYYANKYDSGAISTWNIMLNNNLMSFNEEIDQSIVYGFSYRSKICEMALTQLSGTRTPIVDRMEAPFTKYSIQRGNSVSPTKSDVRNLVKRIGYGVTPESFKGLSTQGIYTRYALAKMRFLCNVLVCEFIEKGDNLMRNNSWTMTLNDFLNHALYTRYINNDNIYVCGLFWKCYIENSAGTANVLLNNTQPIGFYTIPALPEAFDEGTGDNDIYIPSPFFSMANGFFTQGGEGQGKTASDSAKWGRSAFYNTSSNWEFLTANYYNSSYISTWAYVPPEKLMDAFHEFAYFGLYYTGTLSVAQSTALNLDDLYLGVMSNISGATSGKYIAFSSSESAATARGRATEANEATATGTDPMQDPNPHYTGDIPEEDPNTYVTETPLSTPTLSPIDVFNRTYAMTAIQIRALADFLWNADDDKMTEIIEGLALYGENPLNGLIDCRLYPFDLSGISISGQEIIVGRVNTQVYGRKILNTANVVFDLGTCKFMKYFNNFLDYAPYTTGRLFLPYCGLVPIDTAEFMGKEISCKLIVDLITGACCCCIFLDGILTITANGICGIEISMTGTDSSSYANAVVSSFANGIVGVVGAGAGALGGAKLASVGSSMMKSTSLINSLSNTRLDTYNKGLGIKHAGQGAAVASGAGGMLSAAQSFWEAQTTPVQYAQRGSSTPSCETWLPQYPFFIVDSPITDIPSGYGHNVGFACIETGTLSSFSGFTICSNVDTSGFAQATEAERAELKQLLEAGVFL